MGWSRHCSSAQGNSKAQSKGARWASLPALGCTLCLQRSKARGSSAVFQTRLRWMRDSSKQKTRHTLKGSLPWAMPASADAGSPERDACSASAASPRLPGGWSPAPALLSALPGVEAKDRSPCPDWGGSSTVPANSRQRHCPQDKLWSQGPPIYPSGCP